MKKPQSSRVTALLVGAAIVTSREAHAQSSSLQRAAEAQAKYDAAVTAMDAKDFARACPRLEEVVALVPEGIGAKLTLAECYEDEGKLASAWTAYTLVEAATNGKPAQAERMRLAHRRAEALKPRLAQLGVVVAPGVRSLTGLEIKRDGATIDPAQWDRPAPADTGEHVVTATAAGKRAWRTTITIEADGRVVTVAVDTLEDDPSAALRESATTDHGQRGSTQRVFGVVAASAGLASIAAGSVLGVVALSRKSESDAGHCNASSECDPTGIQLRADGRSAATASTIFFLAGGVGLVGGITLFAIAPRNAKVVAPKIAFGPRGIELGGTW
jgi:hypothetical protein